MRLPAVTFCLVERKFLSVKSMVGGPMLRISGFPMIREPPAKPITDDDEAATDAETYKARNWDEFKEANPKGWGNRMNKG